ncbi:MAG: arylsulfatase [Pirellulaceae bacterium]
MTLRALLVAAVLFVPLRGHAAERLPNILVVLFDDMGWGQPPSYWSDSALRTPRLDQLAAEGMRFTDAHAAAAVCTPTRYGLLTGRYPLRIGQFGVLTTYSPPIIPPGRMTVASLLKHQGYHTACIGKWHLGMNWVDGQPGTEREVPLDARMTGGPNDVGFDYFCGFTHARNIGTVIEQDRVIAHVAPVDNQPLMIRKAVEYIDERTRQVPEQPFFLYFPMCPPHEPIVPTDAMRGRSGAQDVVRHHPQYGDWVYQGDAMLGALLDALERNQLTERTLVIATSDNGAEHRPYPPLRESKRSIYEGGHRIPFVARWPGRITPGAVCTETVCLNDVLATCAELVGASVPANAGEDSISLLSTLLGTAREPVREATIHQSPAGELAIRQGPWKLVFLRGGVRQLYNLDSDLSETRDVSESHGDVVERLTARLRRDLDNGRSTAGPAQSNDVPVSLDQLQQGPQRKAKKARSKAKPE